MELILGAHLNGGNVRQCSDQCLGLMVAWMLTRGSHHHPLIFGEKYVARPGNKKIKHLSFQKFLSHQYRVYFQTEISKPYSRRIPPDTSTEQKNRSDEAPFPILYKKRASFPITIPTELPCCTVLPFRVPVEQMLNQDATLLLCPVL